jgi:hypothetical protein
MTCAAATLAEERPRLLRQKYSEQSIAILQHVSDWIYKCGIKGNSSRFGCANNRSEVEGKNSNLGLSYKSKKSVKDRSPMPLY